MVRLGLEAARELPLRRRSRRTRAGSRRALPHVPDDPHVRRAHRPTALRMDGARTRRRRSSGGHRHRSTYRRRGRRQAVRQDGGLTSGSPPARESGVGARRAPDSARHPSSVPWGAWRASGALTVASAGVEPGSPRSRTRAALGVRAPAHLRQPLDRRGREPVRALPAHRDVAGHTRQDLRIHAPGRTRSRSFGARRVRSGTLGGLDRGG
jgi:hypothetical protein